jgi:hypothetical protein
MVNTGDLQMRKLKRATILKCGSFLQQSIVETNLFYHPFSALSNPSFIRALPTSGG